MARVLIWTLIAAALAGCSAGVRPVRMMRAATQDRAAGVETAFQHALALVVVDLDYAEASGRFVPLEGGFAGRGNVERAAECVFWEGYCSEKLGQTADARRLYTDVIARYSETRAADLARNRQDDL